MVHLDLLVPARGTAEPDAAVGVVAPPRTGRLRTFYRRRHSTSRNIDRSRPTRMTDGSNECSRTGFARTTIASARAPAAKAVTTASMTAAGAKRKRSAMTTREPGGPP